MMTAPQKHLVINLENRNYLAFPIVLSFLGGLVRLLPLLRADFPINDGGMFTVMAQDLLQAGLRLPLTTSYNFDQIPFTYPPLAFYLTALLARFAPLVGLVRWLPFVFALACLPAFYGLARAVFTDERAALLSFAVYALITPAYANLLWGGGLTRAPGTFFSLLTLAQVARLYAGGGKRAFSLAALFGALTVLSHPISAWFTVYSAALLFLLRGRSRRNLLASLAVAVAVVVLAAPWWGTLLARSGAQPLLAAFQSRANIGLLESLFLLVTLNLSGEVFLPVLWLAGMAGFALCLRRREWFLPAWLALVFVLERRTPVTLAAVPFALLAGWAVWYVLVPAGRWLLSQAPAGQGRLAKSAVLAATALGCVYLLVSNLLGFSAPVLAPEQRAAMDWVAQNTPPGSRFVVINHTDWWQDPVSEWFPALAQRKSLATVQGAEWISGQNFAARETAYRDLQACRDLACLDHWAGQQQFSFDYVYLVDLQPPAQETGQLQAALASSSAYRVVYTQPGVTIFEK